MNNKQISNTLGKNKAKDFFSACEKTINTSAIALAILSLGFCLLSTLLLWQNSFDAAIKVCGIMVFALLVVFAYVTASHIRTDKIAIILLFALSFVVLGGWNIICDIKPINDYEVLIDGAKSIIDGEFASLAAQKDNYFYFYNFQIGYTFYLSVLLRLLGGSVVALKIVELLVITCSNIVVYKIFRQFFSCEESFFAASLMVMNPYIFMGSGIINNQHISCLLCLLAFYIYLKAKKFIKYVFCGMLLAFSQALRPTTTVVLAAFVICSLLYGIFKKQKMVLFGTATILAAYVIAFNLIDLFFILSDLTPIGIKNTNPYFKLVLGLTGGGITGQTTTSAYHTQLYYDLKAFNFDYEAYKEAAKEHLKTCFIERRIRAEWIVGKMVNFSGGIDNQYIYANEAFNANHSFFVGILNVAGTLLYFASLLFSFVKACAERKPIRNKAYMLCILVFGLFFFAYVFLETQTRYRYEQYYMLFLISMPVFYKTIQKIHLKIKEIKQEQN